MSIADKLSIAFQESPPSLVRNVCIVAHVDHGKTTLADFLISANGIISARSAGKLRYMDSREDERARGITMKSSAISLYYEPLPLLLNLIDSPGHVDFCTEVSSAVNLADIAILLVDAVEGVCSQTVSLIRQSLARNLEIILVLNKIDRLVMELKMSEFDAHQHLQKLIESINACLSKEIQGKLLEEDWNTFEQIEKHLRFDPAKGNVIFASALYGYAFAIEDFALLWAKRLIGHQNAKTKAVNDTTESITKQPIANDSLYKSFCRHLFSRDHYFSKKDGKIKKIKKMAGVEQKEKRTLFEQFVLEPLWELHKCALIQKNNDRLCTLALKLGLPKLKGKRPDEAFPELMRGWLPLSACIIRACSRCRSAEKAYQQPKWERINRRLRKLFLHGNENIDDNFPQELPYTAQCLLNCDPNDPVTIVFVAKSLEGVDQHQQQRRISLCRVMSGTLKTGDQLFIFKTKSKNEIITDENINGENEAQDQCWHPTPVRLTSLFMLSSNRELLQVERVPAGRICGVEVNDGEWVGAHLFCSHLLAMNETPRMEQQKFTESLVRVTIRPANPGASEMSKLREALRHLTILDSAVRIMEQEDGELAMLTAGKVHSQKCLKDLNALGQTNLVESEPIVPFLETLVPNVHVPYAKILNDQLTGYYLRQFSMRIRLRAVPLWGIESDTHNLLTLLQENASLIDSFRDGISNPIQRTQVGAFRTELMECACECLPRLKGSWWAKRDRIDIQRLFSNGILAFGPAKAKLNILFNNNAIADLTENGDARSEVSIWKANLRPLEQAIVCGFHLAMSHGPLCDEPMQAVGIVLEEWLVEGDNQLHQYEQCQTKSENGEFTIVQGQQYNGKESDERTDVSENGKSRKCEQAVEDKNGSNFNDQSKALPIAYLHGNAPQLHGQLISAIRQTCITALKKHTGALRLLAAMYQCHVQTPELALGSVLALLKQKRAKIYNDKINELNSSLYEIVAHMPVVESFSFYDQLLKQSSGTASAQLEFFDWELIDEDPYWEVEEFGRTGGVTLQKNQARQYMDAVRRRKGLPTEDLIVVSAEKQRNLKKNK